MKFLPVVERELRVSSRTSRLYWGRFVAALIAIILVAWIWVMWRGVTTVGPQSREVFGTIATFAFIYSLIIGVLVTADSISEEKREGTLGFLFLTNLKGYDVILGKLFANSLYAFYTLLAILPALAIPLLMGGLTSGDFWRMALVLFISLVFSVSIGMLVSTLSRHERKAQVMAFGVVVFFAGLVPAIAAWLKQELPFLYSDLLYQFSPSYTFYLSFDQVYATRKEDYWVSVVVISSLALLALLLATIVAGGVWKDRPKVGKAFRRENFLKRWRNGTSEGRRGFRTKLLNVNPIYWLTARDRFKPFLVYTFLFFVAVFWLVLFLDNGMDLVEPASFFLFAVFMQTVLKVWVASEAGRRFGEDRKSGALELTLSTPLQVKEIVEGQFLSLMRQFAVPVVLILLFDLAGLIFGARTGYGAPDSDWVLMCIAGMLVFVIDLFALGTLGMWLGLSSKRATRAVGLALFFILALPWLILFVLVTLMSFLRMTGIESEFMKVMLGSYFAISVAIDFSCFRYAAGSLLNKFRAIATTRFT
jgi:ABC-type transport system involved in multi-copper enzyme maturation permease subunit